ncbi:MAG: carboxypeptidase regulatory-like domain-containing protein [Candidatus Solibacter usitatus]|nr:carboxypeptidase regulatory-like domain-containing protein [Candidatus Solibacter usitatus]
MKVLSAVFLVLIMAAFRMDAQNVAGSIKGSLFDPAASPVPNADLILTHAGTGASTTAKSNAAGLFVFPSVLAGTYRIQIHQPGFRRQEISSIDITAGEIRDLGNITLQLGEVKEAVTVIDTPPAMQLASGEKSGLVSGDQMNELALKGRDFFALVSLLPGVVDDGSVSRETASHGAFAGISINGGRSDNKNFTVDGIGALDTGSNNTVHYEPNMDSIAEVKVLTSNYQAEYGRSAAGLISVVTKGGGQKFHGSGWFNYRHEQFNANSFFRNRTGLIKPPYRYRIGGYSIGGPIYIPNKFNSGKSRLFFFASQEFTRQKVDSGAQFRLMPSELERAGNFSRTLDTNGRLVPIIDPDTKTAFPGNMVPANRFNRYGQSILNFFPLPNYTDPDPTLVNSQNYKATASGVRPRRNDMLRFDAYASSKLNGYFRWIADTEQTVDPFGQFNFLLSPTIAPNPGHGYAGHVTYTISPSLLYEFTLGKSFNIAGGRPIDPEAVSRGRVGDLPQLFPNKVTSSAPTELNDSRQMPNIQFGGTPVNPPSVTVNNKQHVNHNDTYDLTNNISWVKASHNLKAGVYYHHNDKVQIQGDAWNGVLNFAVDRNNPFNTGHGYSNALLGYFNTYNESTQGANFHAKYWSVEFFVQDNWRVSRRLTLDYGMRFYHPHPQIDENFSIATFRAQDYEPAKAPRLYRPGFDANRNRVAVDPATGATTFAALIGQYVPGTGDAANGMRVAGKDGNLWGVFRVPAISPAPRFGFAYDLFGNSRTVLRGGIGVFIDRVRQLINANTLNNPPVSYSPTAYYGNLATFTQTGTQAGAGLGPSNITYTFPAGTAQQPSIMSYSLGIQHALPGRTVLDVSWVANISRHLLQARNINPIPIGARLNPANQDPTQPGRPLPDNFLRPYAGIGDLITYEFASASNYNSLQAQVQRRMSKGLRFGGAFTWAKSLGVANTYAGAVSPYFAPRQRNYGPLDFDRRLILAVNYTYDLPRLGAMLRNRYIGAFTDRWIVSGVSTFTTGGPLTPSFTTTAATEISGSTEAARITVVGSPNLPNGDRNFFRNFATEAFAPTPVGSFGNAGVGILRKPGLNNWDIAVSRAFNVGLGEARPLLLRAESYNTFNHAQFTNMNVAARFDNAGNQTNLNFGAFTTARDGRVVSFSLRLRF